MLMGVTCAHMYVPTAPRQRRLWAVRNCIFVFAGRGALHELAWKTRAANVHIEAANIWEMYIFRPQRSWHPTWMVITPRYTGPTALEYRCIRCWSVSDMQSKQTFTLIFVEA
jgi:hypothetical protein